MEYLCHVNIENDVYKDFWEHEKKEHGKCLLNNIKWKIE